jgi:hypothetical protein
MSDLLDRLLEILAAVTNSSAPFVFAETSEISSSISDSSPSDSISEQASQEDPTGGILEKGFAEEMSHSLVKLTTKSTANFLLIVICAVFVFGGGAYFFVIGKDQPESQSPSHSSNTDKLVPRSDPTPAATKLVKIDFRSRPAGVIVRQGKKILGKTPFTHQREVQVGTQVTQTFLFSKKGYKDREIERTMTDSNSEIFTELDKAQKRSPKSRRSKRTNKKPKSGKPANNDEDYKDNPY